MLKRFVSILLVISVLAVLSGCVPDKESMVEHHTNRLEEMGFIFLEHIGDAYSDDYYIVYDNETNVIYYIMFQYSGYFTLCPRYDSNGEVMIYGGK